MPGRGERGSELLTKGLLDSGALFSQGKEGKEKRRKTAEGEKKRSSPARLDLHCDSLVAFHAEIDER